jgi:hypothetical protein
MANPLIYEIDPDADTIIVLKPIIEFAPWEPVKKTVSEHNLEWQVTAPFSGEKQDAKKKKRGKKLNDSVSLPPAAAQSTSTTPAEQASLFSDGPIVSEQDNQLDGHGKVFHTTKIPITEYWRSQQ